MNRKLVTPSLLAGSVAALFLSQVEIASSQFTFNASDPGVRGGAAGAGRPFANLTTNQRAFFDSGADDFAAAEEVDEGLGPRMNLDSCGGCHLQPALGGTSPSVNPQVAFAKKNGSDQQRSLVHPRERAGARGALREESPTEPPTAASTRSSPSPAARDAPRLRARAAGLRDASSRGNNVIFRIPTPIFGAGPDRADPGLRDPREPGEQRVDEELARHPRPAELPRRGPHDHRPDQQQRQRRHDRALRLEGAEQVAADLLRRGLQRRNGHHQRAVPDRARRDAGLPVRDASRTTSPTSTPPRAVDALSAIEKFAIFMRFLAPPTPSSGHARRSDLDRARQAAVHRRRLRAVPHAVVQTGNVDGRGARATSP